MQIEIITDSGPVVLHGSRVVVRAGARTQPGLTPIIVAAEMQPGVITAASAADPRFQETLRGLGVADTVLITHAAELPRRLTAH